jgi:tetratricopeptide (TPR) repeat protein
MSDLTKTQQSIIDLIQCQDSELKNHIVAFARPMLFLSSKEKMDCAQEFYSWAEQNKSLQPLKFHYAEFLLALAHHLSDKHETALGYFQSARNFLESHNDSEGAALCTILIGSIYRTFGNFDLALKTAWEGYETVKHCPHLHFFLGGCLNVMANLSFELHHYKEAEQWFHECYQISDSIDIDYFRVYSLQGLGKVHLAQQKFPEAKNYFEQALQVSEKQQLATSIGNSLTELAGYYYHAGQHVDAENLNLRALALREQYNYTGGAITNCILLGRLYIKEKRWDDALKILEKGLEMAEHIRVRPKIFQIHRLLSDIYKAQGDLARALHHYQLYHEISEEVEKEDYKRKLADARLIFEAEQMRKENIIIRKQKEEIHLKNIELQETIDELTITRISRKAKAVTLVIAIVLFIFEDGILHFALNMIPNSYLISLIVKMIIIFSLSPINGAIEKNLVKKVVKKRNQESVARTPEN